MRAKVREKNDLLNEYRVRQGPYRTTDSYKIRGMFIYPLKEVQLLIVSSGHGPWEHVSVSLPARTPTWEEMCVVKNLFWHDNETVVQYHPKKSEYKNCHPHCLHLWKKRGNEIELPPSILVAP